MLLNILNTISLSDMNVYTYLHKYIYDFMDTKDWEQLTYSKTYEELFNKAFEFGVFPIVAYLYQNQNIKYNYALLTNFNSNMSSQTCGDNMGAVSTGSSNTSCRIQQYNKYYNFKAICYNYLQYLKKYSIMTSSNKNFYYKLNRQVDTEEYLTQWLDQMITIKNPISSSNN